MSLTFLRKKSRKVIRPILWGFSFIFFASCFTLYGSYMFSSRGAAGQAKRIIAKVNGEEIPRDIYDRNVEMALRYQQQMAGMQQVKVGFQQEHMARGQAFEQIVESFLKAQAA